MSNKKSPTLTRKITASAPIPFRDEQMDYRMAFDYNQNDQD